MKKNIPTVVAAGVLVLILGLYMVTYQVRYTEVAVVTTFGKPGESQVAEGFHFKWPWPIQRVIKYDARLRILEGSENELRTRDEQNLVVLGYAGWRVKDPRRFIETLGQVATAEARLRTMLRTHKKTAVGKFTLAEIVSKGQETKLEEIERLMYEPLAHEALDQFGIEIAKGMVGIKRISLPESTTQKVFDRMRADQDKKANEFRTRGQAAAAGIRARAQSERTRILSFADRLAGEIVAVGEREAAQQYEVFKQNEAFAMFLQELDFLKKTLPEKVIYLLDSNHPGTRLFAKGPAAALEHGGGAGRADPMQNAIEAGRVPTTAPAAPTVIGKAGD